MFSDDRFNNMALSDGLRIATNIHNNQFSKVFQTIKFLIFDFLIIDDDPFDLWNYWDDLINLMKSCKMIRNILFEPFINKRHFDFEKVYSLNPRFRSMIRNIFINDQDKIICNDVKERFPMLRRLFLGGNLHLTKDQFPENLQELDISSGYQSLDIKKMFELPERLIKLNMPTNFNERMLPGFLPQNLQELRFYSGFDQTIDLNVLPDSLIKLSLGYIFNRVISHGVLPENLVSLEFSQCFNQVIDCDVLPNKLKNLTFGKNYNQPLKNGVLPQSLTKLTFGWFKKSIYGKTRDDLFEVYNHAYSYFDQPIEIGSLPSNLVTLIFSDRFNQPLEIGSLSSNLIKLEFVLFDQPLKEGILPKTLKKLVLPYFNQDLRSNILPCVPLGLVKLTIRHDCLNKNQQLNVVRFLPLSLRKLVILEWDQSKSINQLDFYQKDFSLIGVWNYKEIRHTFAKVVDYVWTLKVHKT